MDNRECGGWIRRISTAVALTAGVAACGSQAADPPEVGSTSQDIIGGFSVTSARLNAIGAIGVDSGTGTFVPSCSGTLISPTMVLTAKHCVSNIVDPTKVAFLIGPNALAPIRVVPARGAAGEPTVVGGQIGFGSDVGILHLAVPVLDVTPLPFAALTDDRIGSRMVAIGYGVQDFSGTSGTRQGGSMTLRATSGSVLATLFGTFENFLANGAARLFPGVDPSDPGQLAFLQQEFDEIRLLDGIEAWFGAAPGDAQSCFGDGGGPITAKLGTETTVFGVGSWLFAPGGTCTLDGGGFATINPVSLDFIDYETHCPLIPRAGTCEGLGVAVRCADNNEGGHRELRTDCGVLDQVCGLDPDGEVGCIDDPCEGLPPEGVCNGEVATRCSQPGDGFRRVVTTDCLAQGQSCAIEDGAATCVDAGPACSHDLCVSGDPLVRECDDCVAKICTIDPFCCDVFWDGICVGEVQSICGETCTTGPIAPDSRR